MTAATTGLKDVHQLHIALEEAQRALDRGPKRVKACEKAVTVQKQRIADLSDQSKKIRMLVDQRSLQLATSENNILGLKAKLNQAASNREFEIISSQIKADTVATSVLEDEILEVMTRVDKLNREIATAETEMQSLIEKQKEAAARVASEQPGLQVRVSELQESLAEAEKVIPSTVMTDYRRLVQAYGADSLAAVDGQACQCCFAEITRQQLVNLNIKQFVFCPSCGRLLYSEPE